MQQGADTLQRGVRAGDRDDPARLPRVRAGFEQLGVHAQWHGVQLLRRDAEIGDDVGGRRRRDGHQVGDLARHLLLHLGEAVPPAHQRFSPPSRGPDIQYAVPGDGVVHGGDHRQAGRGDSEESGAEALVVVDDVEIAGTVGQQPRDAHGERARFGKARRPHGQQLQQIDRVADLAGPRHPEGIGLPVEIEAGHLGQPHPRIEQVGIRLPGEHLDVVPQFDQPVAEMSHVDALSAAMGLTTVGQQGNSHTQLFCTGERWRNGAEPVAVNRLPSPVTANWTCVQTIVRCPKRAQRPGLLPGSLPPSGSAVSDMSPTRRSCH